MITTGCDVCDLGGHSGLLENWRGPWTQRRFLDSTIEAFVHIAEVVDGL